MYGLKDVLGPINNPLIGEKSKMKGVVFEDNPSSQKAIELWNQELTLFTQPCFRPLKMKMIIQVVDRHVGVKEAVY